MCVCVTVAQEHAVGRMKQQLMVLGGGGASGQPVLALTALLVFATRQGNNSTALCTLSETL